MEKKSERSKQTKIFWVDYEELKNGRIKIFRRKNVSSRFYARFTFRGEKGFVDQSLGTSSATEAREIAVERYLQLEHRIGKGLSIRSKKFKDVAAEYLAHLESLVARGEIKQKKCHDQRLVIERYFDDWFGEKPIQDIGRKEIDAYREWRKDYWVNGKGAKERHLTYYRNGKIVRSRIRKSIKGKVPSRSTINSEETVLRSVFKMAVTKGYVGGNEMPQIRTERVTFTPRSTFSEKEYRKLLSVARKRIDAAEKMKRDREACLRHLLYNYILIASNCGARVTELMNLRWKDIEWNAKGANNSENMILSVSGKSKSRDLVANDICRDYFSRILEKQKHYSEKYEFPFSASDEFVFSDHRGRVVKSFKGSFEKLMDAAGVVFDLSGNRRSLGSLRIFYCTMRLLKGEGVDLYDLALNMGTSVTLLQRTYSRLTARLKADKIKRRDTRHLNSAKEEGTPLLK